MTKILFVQEVLFDYAGIEYLAGALKKANHQTDIFIVNAEKQKLSDYINQFNPDIVAFSISSSDYKWCIPSAQTAKELGKYTIFGGPHPTYFPDFINESYVDAICIGEAEEPFTQFANNFENGKDITSIKNIWVKKDGQVYKNPVHVSDNLLDLPQPDRQIYYKYKFLKNIPVKRVATSRGCVYGCTFCYNQYYKEIYNKRGKQYVRERKKEDVLDELLELKRISPVQAINFTSDVFAFNKEWLIDFLKDYKTKVDLPYYCQVTANELADEDIVKLLKESGCEYICFGVEAGNEDIRTKVYRKAVTNEKIIKAAYLLHKYDLKFQTYNIIGAPHETLENVWETINLNKQIKPDTISATILQPQVGTPIHKQLIAEDLFIPGYENSMAGHYTPSPIKLQNKEKIENLHKFFYYVIIYPYTSPLVKMLINLPPNIIFNLLFKLSLFLRYKKSRRLSMFQMMKLGWSLRKFS